MFEVLRLLLDAELEAGLDALESPFSSYESAPSSTKGAGGCLPAGFVSAMVRCSLMGLFNDSRQYSAEEAVGRSSARYNPKMRSGIKRGGEQLQ